MKHILLVNDDGINAPGLAELERVFKTQPDFAVSVIAPDRQRSANSHFVNLWSPLRLSEHGPARYAIDGTPADCVKLGHFFLETPVDLVVSGINSGQNMGVDVYYSGTVAAAREAIINGLQGMAVSLSSKDEAADYRFAAKVALEQARVLLERPLPAGTLLNVNVPDLPETGIRGVKVTRLGKRVYRDGLDRRMTPFGQTYFWLSCDGMSFTPCEDGDLDAVHAGYVSLTPVLLDATDYRSLESLAGRGVGREADPVV
ncbi:MAG TPA: 5'/3'-nucleotidase SurE [Spirochaetota bacterium]|nr:5'/3'-nucleotidase SurE [Spirochaetota bacterium]HPH01677.1 5'/3'-nucleotidase SurE [Spirochaetota bacterium]